MNNVHGEDVVLQNLETRMKTLIKLNAEAKDNDKFLNTLERQFKILQNYDLTSIEQCLPSLFNGLRLVFIISRHYKENGRMEQLLVTISNQICDRVSATLNLRTLLKPKENVFYEKQLDEAIKMIEQAQRVLTSWVKLYKETKDLLEKEGAERWDYGTKVIKGRPQHMNEILTDFMGIAQKLRKFFVLLGPKLKAVTGNTDEIDDLIVEVKGLVKGFETTKTDFFNKKSDPHNWNNIYNTFNKESKKIQGKASALIRNTFGVLRSSLAGFEFLQKFNNLDTLEEISAVLKDSYDNVLESYRKELEENNKLYQKGKDKLLISKNKPPVAGTISWKKAIFHRIKAPIVKFLTKADIFDQETLGNVKAEYLKFAKELDAYEDEKFKEWSKKVGEQATEFLKNSILGGGENGEKYYVNFLKDFKILIAEAKYLDRITPKVSKRILNIALQEKGYYKYVDKLNKMLREYYDTINSLKDVEQNLLNEDLKKLEQTLIPGTNSYNLNSLGIKHFIQSCTKEIKKFQDIKNKVEEKTRNIEDIIKTIEKAEILREFDLAKIHASQSKTRDYFTLHSFIGYFEKYLQTEVAGLADKYMRIGETMLPQISNAIYSSAIFKSSKDGDKKVEQMRLYYYYWERRVYNALIKMTIRGLLKFKMLLSRPKKRPIPLFKVQTEFTNPKVNTNPNFMEIRVTIEKFVNSIIDSSSHFYRWMDGTCICVQPRDDKTNDEDAPIHTFARDIAKNTVITRVVADISQIKQNAVARLETCKRTWEVEKIEDSNEDVLENYRQGLWDPKHRSHIDKKLEKNSNTSMIEFNMEMFHTLLEEYKENLDEMDVDFIKIDFSKVKKAFIKQARERLVRVGNLLVKIAHKDVEDLQGKIAFYHKGINSDEDTRNKLKKCLNMLAEIKDKTMDTEFEIADVVEKFRILKKYEKHGLVFEEEKYNTAMSLQKMWLVLLARAKAKDHNLKRKKEAFSSQTNSEVSALKSKIAELHDEYIATGPGALATNLDDGLVKMDDYKVQVEKLNAKRAELVLNQKLFNLDISSYPKLVTVEKSLNMLKKLYDFYGNMKQRMDEWSKKAWDDIQYRELEEGKRFFQSNMRELKSEYNDSEVFKKLKIKVDEFKSSLPLIKTLKENPFFKTNHWKRLLRLIDQPIDGIDFSSITLEQVFNMNLQDYPNEVGEVVNAAKNEYNNQQELNGIKDYWKTAEITIVEFKKGNKIKVSEDIKQDLDNHLNDLQGIEGNKFAGPALKKEVRKWMNDLSHIQETLEIWIQVQTKWLYLEGIYIGNEDIRQQLPKPTTTFEQHDKNFRKINDAATKTPNIYVNCVVNDTTKAQLKNLSTSLDKSQKKLKDYLESKKKEFPRFYFISDEDLLSILGSSEVTSIQPQLIKLFDNCKSLIFENNKIVKGMRSDKGEFYLFSEDFKPDGAVEKWMNTVEEKMRSTLRRITKEGIYMYANMERTDWIEKYLGMVVIVGTQVWWTWRVEDVFKKVAKGDKYAMKKESKKQTDALNDLIGLMRSDLESKDPKGKLRKKINTLIIIDVHGRDIVDKFVRDSILDAREFEWESQLRFYWRNNINDIQIEQCTGVFRYGYEYQGLKGRLVITPLTDRCVMTLTTALTFCLGGAPAGPAGTGKTETCKDLAKSLAIRCVVTNCGENFDAEAMANIFSGLCQTGFWGCYDEFNRIKPEVLSVVSTQISDIQRSLRQNKKTVELMDNSINLVKTVGIFITMNPGYEGRSELPDNLKALFRPVTMVVPDKFIICENMLMSEGFEDARVLAKKMTVLYKLSFEQLSKQYHYDFGLRALKSVLVMAGSLKRGSPDIPEEKVLMRALKDMNMPKFVHEDVSLFYGLLGDLFPGLSIDTQSHKDMAAKIKDSMLTKGLQPLEDEIRKVIQLYETMETRHTTMVVGPTGAGKTTIINLLKDARTIENVRNVVIYIMNPKAQGLFELYGFMDKQTRDWTDGILSHTFKVANADLPERGANERGPKEELRWILFDGDVDAVWVENMNSVMDDNRLLTLSNGARYRLKPYCNLLFEVFDLQYASPATISRCGMVYVDPKNLGYEPYFYYWKAKWSKIAKEEGEGEAEEDEEGDDMIDDMFEEMYQKYIPPMINFIYEGKTSEDQNTEPLEMNLERTPLNLVRQFCALMDAIIPEDTVPNDPMHLEYLFVFCSVWSFGSCLVESDRERFIQQLKQLSNVILPINNPLYDCFYDYRGETTWIAWERRVGDYEPPADGSFHKILVPTVDTVKYSYLLKILIDIQEPIIFVGEPGTAKTVIIQNFLGTLSLEDYTLLNVNFSSRTTSMEVQKNIESVTDKIRPAIWGPKMNKKLIVFIDELHMPIVDKYGTQQPIALLKFLIDKGIMYERGGKLQERTFKNTQFVSALLPPGGGYNKVDPRFLSLFSTINILFPNEKNIKRIYNEILSHHVGSFNEDIKDTCKDITNMTYKLYQKIIVELPRSPIKFHYIFNLRDLSKVYQGMLRSTPEVFKEKAAFIKLWRHECTRVFVDRLRTEKDKELVSTEIIPDYIKETFGDEVVENSVVDPQLFGDFMLAEPTEPELVVPEIYQDLESFEKVRKKCEDMLEQYEQENMTEGSSLVLFDDALDHIVRIIRILKMPRGNAMLVGVGGSGKRSLTKLACFICGYRLFEIQLKKNYKESHFFEDIKRLYMEHLLKEKTLFLFSDSQILEEGFLEMINTMLTVGVINALFDDATKMTLRNQKADECRRAKRGESPDEIWNFVTDILKNNLHVVLAMSPAGDSLRVRCRNFPGLVSNTTIDWFFPWPKAALTMVAEVSLMNYNFEPEVLDKIIPHFVKVHQSIPDYSKKYEAATKRKVFSTPKNYLDFLSCYLTELETNKKDYRDNIRNYEKGLLKLESSKASIKVMREKLDKDRKVVEARQSEVRSLNADVTSNKEKAEKAQEKATKKEEELTIQEKQIAIDEAEANKLFAEKKPELLEAKKKLQDIKKSALTEIASYPNGGTYITMVCECLLILRVGKDLTKKDSKPALGWANAKSILSGSLIDSLKNYPIKKAKKSWISQCLNHITKLEGELRKKDGEKEYMDIMKQINKPVAGLYDWVKSTLSLDKTFREITRLEENAERLTNEKEQSKRELKETREMLTQLSKTLTELNIKLKQSTKELSQLESELKKMQTNLDNGTKLIEGLSSEQIRWTKEKKDREENILLLEAECLLNASFLSYFGPFDQQFRTMMMNDFKGDILAREMIIPETFKVEDLLTNDVEISKWNTQGLPGDPISIQNAILTSKATRYPFCIDPQQQAVSWIKRREKDINAREFQESSMNNPRLTSQLEMCFKNGFSLLIENVTEEIDPLLDPILLKEYKMEGAMVKVMIGDKEIDVTNDDFRLYMTSKLPNPDLSPEVMGKTSVINFSVNMDGLRQQLLNEVVGFEKEEEEKRFKKLVIDMSNNKKELKDNEQLLLDKLSNVQGSLLEDTELIKTLQDSKSKAQQIAIDLKNGEITKEQLEESRQSYNDVAKRGAILFFTMRKLSAISEMYEYSLNSYLNVFKRSLEQAMPDDLPVNRRKNIIDTLTMNIYDYVTYGIFKDHRRVFKLQMTLMIMEGEDELNFKELDFFLKGNTSLDSAQRKNPINWISDVAWKDLEKLRTLGDDWKEFCIDLEDNEHKWKDWYDLETPETEKIPEPFDKKFTSFQLLLILRLLRPDRVSLGIDQFIVERFQGNKAYLKMRPFDPQWLLDQADSKTPIIYILSSGADPSASIRKMAEDNNFTGKSFLSLSLGQNMEDIAADMVRSGSQRGYWVLLQNCDLLPEWLKELEKILEEIDRANDDFKLWLTTRPSKKFPLGILQKSIKIVTEPPEGIKSNMEAVITKVEEKSFDKSKHYGFKRLTYVLTFIHAVLLDRIKYGKIGWNVKYDFNFSDFKISFELLQLYLNKSLTNNEDTIPWGSLKYLIGNAMYGGRVTDDYDRRVLLTYLDEYMGDFLFDDNHKFIFAKTNSYEYELPLYKDKDELIKILDQLPTSDSPVAFGLHPNAEITYFTNDAKQIWRNFLAMQSVGSSGGNNLEQVRYITGIADDILGKSEFDIDVEKLRLEAIDKYKTLSPSQVVLYQELERFKKLSDEIVVSLNDLKRALSGKIGMSETLDLLSVSLFNGFLPKNWAKLAPMTQKKLGSWINHYMRRKEQYLSWIKREPAVMWLSGLHIPESYLTALVQAACRAKQWALDKSTLFTTVTKIVDPKEVTEKPEFGCYVQGLYLEGVSWDIEMKCIKKQSPKELIYEMPIIKINPVEANKLKLKDSIKVPVYVTQNRRNAAGFGHVFDADLSTDEHPSHWILQGICMVLNTDQ